MRSISAAWATRWMAWASAANSLIPATVAGLASAAGHGTNMGVTLLVVPAMYFVYVYYRMHIFRAVLDNLSNASQENEAALAGASRSH